MQGPQQQRRQGKQEMNQQEAEEAANTYCFSPVKPLYENDHSWYVNNNPCLLHDQLKSQSSQENYESHILPSRTEALFLQTMGSSSDQTYGSAQPKPYLSSVVTAVCNYPFDDSPNPFSGSGFVDPVDFAGFSGFNLQTRLIHPLVDSASAGGGFSHSGSDSYRSFQTLFRSKRLMLEENRSLKNMNGDGGVDSAALNSDSEEPTENYLLVENQNDGLEISNATCSLVDGDDKKGKKAKLPAKNLMAERRRRKKLNDRLYMLRSVVPKISKMDRASILVDTIDYLKDLLQRIRQLNDELQSLASGHPTQPAPSLLSLTSVIPSVACHVKEEESITPPPINRPPSVHVELREENAFNVHMFCARRPGLLLSIMKTLDNLGLEVHQAVISCFNGFALDVFRAEKFNQGLEVGCDQIKAALLDTAAFHGLM